MRQAGGFADGDGNERYRHHGVTEMLKVIPSMAQQIAQAAMAFQLQRTGHAAESATVVLSDHTVVVTLHGALSKAERALAKSPEGATKVQEFHRQLFSTSSESLRREIKKIIGVDVRESTAEVQNATGAVVTAFTTGTMVQVFLLAQKVAPGTWPDEKPTNPPATKGMLL
jgi:uncharacterized protein YbcI